MMTYSKYKNIKSGGCDSRKEERRLQELQLLERAGLIKDLQRQVKFVLIPAQYEAYPRFSKTGKRLKDGARCLEKECSYYADFTYTISETGENIVEDAKGVRTEAYRIKRKLMLAVHSIRITET